MAGGRALQGHEEGYGPPSPTRPASGPGAARDAEFRELLALYCRDIVLLFDDQFRLLACDERAAEAYGYTRDELLALTLTDLGAIENPVALEEHRAAVRERRSTVFEGVHRRKDGSTFPEETSVRVVETESGTRYLTTIRDISELKLAEDELRVEHRALERHEELLATLLDTIPSPVFYKDAAGVYLGCNSAFEQLLGRARGEIVGKSAADMGPPEIAARYDAMDRELFEHPGTQTYEWQVQAADGSRRDVVFKKATFSGDDGKVAGLVGVMLDVTERKTAEAAVLRLNAELEQRVAERTRDLTLANAELEDFVHSIAHDLRSPLRALGGFSEIVSADYSDVIDETGRGHLQRIHAAAVHMGDVMDALLALSSVSRSRLLIGDVDLSGLARLVADRLRATDPGRAVEFEIEDGLVARADSSLCEVLLQNLLGNAWKFSAGASPGRISFVRATVDGRSAYCVSDNGVGFEQKYAGCLFRPFERLHAPGEFPGTGIGLATVRRIVSRFEGECWAEGEVGRGASIFFTLPASA